MHPRDLLPSFPILSVRPVGLSTYTPRTAEATSIIPHAGLFQNKIFNYMKKNVVEVRLMVMENTDNRE